MSGARALASARRRRAAPENTKPNAPPPLPVPPRTPTTTSSVPASAPSTPQKVHPAAMMLNHDKVLQN